MVFFHGVLHYTKWIMFHSMLDIGLGPSKIGGFDAKLGTMTSNKIIISFYTYCHGGTLDYFLFGMFIEYVVVPYHGPLSLSRNLKAQNCKNGFLFPMTFK